MYVREYANDTYGIYWKPADTVIDVGSGAIYTALIYTDKDNHVCVIIS